MKEQHADPQLLSLLEKVSNPLKGLTVQLEIKGVFAPVEQWKLTDDANPNIFTYSIQLLGKEFDKGKIQPRQQTQKEIRQAEEVKSKKGGKKDSKVEEEKKLLPEEQEEEARKKAQWEALSQQEKFYFKNEDPYQMPFLKFQKGTVKYDIEETDIDKFQADIQKGDIDVILIRKPDVNQEQINKLKKSKPKGLNLAELTKVTFQGKLNVSKLLSPGGSIVTDRVKLVQVEEGLPADTPKFEMKDCYVYMAIKINPPLVPLVESIKPQVEELYVAKPTTSTSNVDELIRKLKGEIIIAVKSISADYSNMFAKDKDFQEEKKQTQTSHYSQMKVTEINKRKELFMNEFKTNGKYALLRSRVEKIIKTICLDKLTKQKGFNKPKPQELQRSLSELSVFLNQQISATINDYVSKRPDEIHEDILLSHRISRESLGQVIHPITSETSEDKYIRISVQYEIINRLQQAEENLQNLILLNPKNDALIGMYVSFCLRHKKFDTAECQLERLLSTSDSLENRTLLAILLLRRNRLKQSIEIIKGLLEDSRATNQQKILHNQLASLILERQGDRKQSERYLTMAEKLYKMKLNLPVKLDEQEDPYQQPKPRVPKPTKTISLLTNEQAEDMNCSLLQLLADYNFLDLVQQQLHRVADSPKKTLWITQAALFHEDYSKALQHIEQLLETNNKNYEWLLLKADICFLSQRLFECQEVFLKVTKIKPNAPKTFALYLRLGNIYLLRKAWQDARNIFLKACELKSNSSLSWLGLGRAHLNLGEMSQAQEALNLANIYEPFNKEVEIYLNEVRLAAGKQKGGVNLEESVAA